MNEESLDFEFLGSFMTNTALLERLGQFYLIWNCSGLLELEVGTPTFENDKLFKCESFQLEKIHSISPELKLKSCYVTNKLCI